MNSANIVFISKGVPDLIIQKQSFTELQMFLFEKGGLWANQIVQIGNIYNFEVINLGWGDCRAIC